MRVSSAHGLARHVALHAGHAQRARGLRDRAGVLVDVLDRGADLVGADEEHLVHALLSDAEGLPPHLPDRHPVGEDADLVEHDALTRRQRIVHGGRFLGLDSDDPYVRPQRLDVGSDAPDQAPASDCHEDGVNLLAVLAQDLHRHRALARDDVRIVEGVDVDQVALGRQLLRSRLRLVVRNAVEHDLRTQRAYRVHLDPGRGLGHHDEGPDPEAAARQRDPLSVVARRRCDHPARPILGGQRYHLVVCASRLEGEDRLQVLALDQHPVPESPGKQRRGVERRLAGHVVDSGAQDSLHVLSWHIGSRAWDSGRGRALTPL